MVASWTAVEVSSTLVARFLHCEHGPDHRRNSPAVHRVPLQYVFHSNTAGLNTYHAIDALNQSSWIGTAFTLTDTAFVPVFVQLADVFGHYAALQFAVVIMTWAECSARAHQSGQYWCWAEHSRAWERRACLLAPLLSSPIKFR
jgi:MFS family permease